jgi:hypothetical protein
MGMIKEKRKKNGGLTTQFLFNQPGQAANNPH